MAAKQGLSAQISQASEDAKRAVLNRTNLKSSLWFSNLNTTCTIKSAPPRSPEVLELLATKTGYLFKRNEQHVWQSRWCCVVPHTFLYYFDVVHPNTVTNVSPPKLTSKQQEMLNQAVQHGYGKRGEAKQQQPRSSLYHVLGGGTGTAAVSTSGPPDGSAVDTGTMDSASLQPAGIIDLECYTTIHRNSKNNLLLELAGDETVNPDLRSFYFCSTSESEGEDWTQALLNQRHSSLVDEKEAYQQVCEGFSQQLQILHAQLDEAQLKEQNQHDELYRVRSQMEDTRRNCWRLVQDTLERSEPSAPAAKKAYRTDLETIQSQDLGLLAAVQLLCDYTKVLEETCGDCTSKVTKLQSQLEQRTQGDETKVHQLEAELAHVKQEMMQQQNTWQTQLETLQQKYLLSQKEYQDVQKDLANQKVEMTMYQSTTRSKMNQWKEQKRVLKKEVLELRGVVKDLSKEVRGYRSNHSVAKIEIEQERKNAKRLERYVEKMESHVKMQQNMMEMMSAAGSVYGGDGEYDHMFDATSAPGMVGRTVRATQSVSRGDFGSVNDAPLPRSASPSLPPPGKPEFDGILMNTPSSVQDNEEPSPAPAAYSKPQPTRGSSTRRMVSNSSSSNNNKDDDDNKSHMSELTEDRTQKQFDAAFLYQQHHIQKQTPNIQMIPQRTAPLQTTQEGPPTVIGVSYEQQQLLDRAENASSAPKLDTIMSVHSSKAPSLMSNSRLRNEVPRYETSSSNATTAANNTSTSSSGGISSSAPKYVSSTPPTSGSTTAATQADSGSASSLGSKPKLSVAQRARLEADRQTTPVKVRMDTNSMKVATPVRNNTASPSLGRTINTTSSGDSSKRHKRPSPSRGGFLATLGRRFEDVLDNSVLGVTMSDDETSARSGSYATSGYTNAEKLHSDEKKVADTASEASTNVSLSLVERQAIQRAQQMRFLKTQGIIRNEEQVRGGAGSTMSDAGSVVSSAASPSRSIRG